MSSPFYSPVGFAALIADVKEMFTPEFWITLYRTGQFGDFEGKLLVLILVRLLVITLIILGARILVGMCSRAITRGVRSAITRSGHGQRRLTTLQGLLSSTLAYLLYFVAFILILFTCGFTPKALAPLLASASILGLAVGFGAQKLVRDVITGLFILGEGQFDVGDWVTIGTVTGRVVDIGLRITRLRDEQGREYIIANGDITQVFNASRGLVKLSIEVALQRSEGVDEGLDILRNAAEETLAAFKVTAKETTPLTLTLMGMDATKVTVRMVLWVPVAKRDAIEDAVRRRVLELLARGGVTCALA